MKKLLFLLFAFALTFNFTACSNDDDDDNKVVTTSQGSVTYDGKTYTIKYLVGVRQHTTYTGQEMNLYFMTDANCILEVTIGDKSNASNWYDGITYTTMAEIGTSDEPRYFCIVLGEDLDEEIFFVEYGKNNGNVRSVVNTYENNSDVLRVYGETRANRGSDDAVFRVEFDVYVPLSEIEAKNGIVPW